MRPKRAQEKRSGAVASAHALPTRSEETLTILVRMSTIFRKSTNPAGVPR